MEDCGANSKEQNEIETCQGEGQAEAQYLAGANR
jgi:hypothetical protein